MSKTKKGIAPACGISVRNSCFDALETFFHNFVDPKSYVFPNFLRQIVHVSHVYGRFQVSENTPILA